MVEVIIRGAEDLERIGKAVREIGDKQLRLELLRAIRTATKPTKQQIKASALATLPKRGGLAALIASSNLSTRTRLSGRRVGVRIEARNHHDIRALDKGRLRHPLYGDRDHWFQQYVQAGWFSRPMFVLGKAVRVEISDAVADIVRKHLK